MSAHAHQRKLERPRQWALRFWTRESMPSMPTLRKWVDEYLIEGEWINGECYVYDDQKPPRTRQRPAGAPKRTLVEPETAGIVAEFAEKLRKMDK